MHLGRTTLSKFLIQELRGQGSVDHNDIAALLVDIAAAVKAIAAMTAKGALADVIGSLETENVQGEKQQKLDVLSDRAFINTFRLGGLVAGLASEENEQPILLGKRLGFNANHLTLFDPLDGSSNIDVNVSVGSIFSVIKAPEGRDPVVEDFLQTGEHQVAAGYAIYGPATMLVITIGRGTHGFTLDREVGNFILTHPDMTIPEESAEFAINTSNERFWEPPVQRYIDECKAGRSGIRDKDFNMRWIASMVADVHRILMRGGVFLCPRDTRDPDKPGKLRLMYEANPMSFVIEQAGGLASTGRTRIMTVQPEHLHQRIPVVLGSRNEVLRVERYHREFDSGTDRVHNWPLFGERSLFRD